ncbi:MAG: riboflavin synthase [Alphaproteobacteria bacterium]|nr:riboflavin synthase [Alphaproteobacteria bacterium]
MFTGIITDIGCVAAVRGNIASGLSIDIETRLDAKDLLVGASVACSGVCLTVTEPPEPRDNVLRFSVDVSPESLSVTAIGQWSVGHAINLEPALRMGDTLGGHWVSGHVDGVGIIERVIEAGEGHQRWFITCPNALMGYIAERGSIAVDGCSLTVVEVSSGYFAFNMIPHTRVQASFRHNNSGDLVHLEVDILARYVACWNAHDKDKGNT